MLRRYPPLLQGLIKYTPSQIMVYQANEKKELQKTNTIDISKYQNVKEVHIDNEVIEKLKKEMEESSIHSVY
jgi:hypothetical protein